MSCVSGYDLTFWHYAFYELRCLSVHMFQFENNMADFDQIWCERFATKDLPIHVHFNFLQLVTNCWRMNLRSGSNTNINTEINNTNRGNDRHQSNCSNKFPSCTSSQLFGTTCRNIKDTVVNEQNARTPIRTETFRSHFKWLDFKLWYRPYI
jgi:hypothetical protein